MKKTRIKGFIDPITIGFILAISSTATILTVDAHSSIDKDSQVSSSGSVVTAQVVDQKN